MYLNESDIKRVSDELSLLKLVRKVDVSLQDDDEYQLEFDVKQKDLTSTETDDIL